MEELLSVLKQRGIKSSSFLLAVFALLLPYVAAKLEPFVQSWGAGHGWVGGLVAAVYVAARAYVDAHKIKAAAAGVTAAVPVPAPPVPNVAGVMTRDGFVPYVVKEATGANHTVNDAPAPPSTSPFTVEDFNEAARLDAIRRAGAEGPES